MAQQGLCILVLWSIVEREREGGESRDEGETDIRGKLKGYSRNLLRK